VKEEFSSKVEEKIGSSIKVTYFEKGGKNESMALTVQFVDGDLIPISTNYYISTEQSISHI
jgi:hypothetical protein